MPWSRAATQKPLIVAAKPHADEAWLAEVARLLWALPEREYHYTAIDLLAKDGVVGAALNLLTLRFPELKVDMDDLSGDANFWLRRAAILHTLKHRKAIGWVLRTYAYTDPLAVAVFVEANKSSLSTLSVREALKHYSDQY